VSNSVIRTFAAILLLSGCVYFSIAQQQRIVYQTLLQQYENAQQYYDKATALNSLENYGDKEEALEKEWNEKALQGFSAIYEQAPKQAGVYDSLRFHISFKIGELQHYFENFAEAVKFYKDAIAIKEKSKLPDSLLFKPYLYAGIILYNQNKFDTAISFFKKAESVQAAYNNRLAEAERLYNILGVLHYERGNYKQAQNYFQKALALLPRSNPYYEELFVNYNINLAQIHLRLEEYDKANQIYIELLPHKVNLNEIYHNIGSLNLSLGAAAKAISYFHKVNYQNNKIVRLQNSIGQAFFNLLQLDSAMIYYQKAIASYKSLGANSDPVGYGLVLKNLGDYYIHLQKNKEALSYYHQAIHQFYPAFKEADVHANPENFSGVFSYINLFHALNGKAAAWHNIYLQEKKAIAPAKEELNTYKSAFRLIEYVEQTYDSDEARLFLSKIKHAAHNKPIDIASELYKATKDKAFIETLYYFDQQNKAAVLSLNRQLNATISEKASPERQKEQQLKTEITRLSIRAAQVQDSLQLVSINNTIRDHEISLGKLKESRNAPLSLKEDNIPSIKTLQDQLLDEKTALVSYHLSDEKLTTIVLTKKTVDCFQQNLPENFTENIQKEIVRIKTPSDKPAQKNGFDYFDLLLANVPLAQIDQLVIIPDDVLAYFPFESLQDKNGKYLVESVAAQYQYSTSLLQQNKVDFSDARTLAFAPFANQSYDSLPILSASAEEVADTKGQLFINDLATKEAFLKNSGNFQIIHLATHAVANSSAENLSYIAFAPSVKNQNLLYTQEIYNLPLSQTDLIILSACETGAGQLVKGEGILSLSRAFSYAGCPNTITSLWKANDFSTAYLTKKIYHYLNTGKSIAKAVQQAKKDYLADKSINPRLKQPYYWSHLIFMGNYTPTKNTNWFALMAPALFILLLLLVLKKPGKGQAIG